MYGVLHDLDKKSEYQRLLLISCDIFLKGIHSKFAILGVISGKFGDLRDSNWFHFK